MLIRQLAVIGIAFTALPVFAQSMPPLPGDHEFTNCQPAEPLLSSTSPDLVFSATSCSSRLRKAIVVEGKYLLLMFKRYSQDARLYGQDTITNSYYSAHGISCADGLNYSKSIAERWTGKGIEYASSGWKKLDLAKEYPGDAEKLNSNSSNLANLLCPLRPGFSKVGNTNLDLRSVIRNNDRANVRGYLLDKDYLLTLDCRRLTFGIDAEPKIPISPNSGASEAFKKICVASRK